MIIIIPFGLIMTIIGFIAYRLNVKAEREMELRQIQNRLAQIERQKAAIAAGEVPEEPARSRRLRVRR